MSARNALANFSGFSPNQLVSGFNPALPDVFRSQIAAIEPVTSSVVVRENLNALHYARREFIRCESDEKLGRALRHNARENFVEDLNNGYEVYYRRNDSPQ